MEFELSHNLSKKHVSLYGENVRLVKNAEGSYAEGPHGVYYNKTKFLDAVRISINDVPLVKSVRSSVKLWGVKQFHTLLGLQIERSILPKKDSFLDILHITNMSGKPQKISLDISAILAKKKTYHRRLFDQIRHALIVEDEGSYFVFGPGRIEKEHEINHPYKKDKLLHHVHKVHKERTIDDYSISFELEPSEALHVPIVFAFSHTSQEDALDIYDRLYSDWKGRHLDAIQKSHILEKIETPSSELNRAFTWSVHVLEQLGSHPFSLSRQDILWVSHALLDLGKKEEANALLHRLFEKDPMLFSFAASNYLDYLDTQETRKELEYLITEAKKHCTLEDYVVQGEEEEPTIESPHGLHSPIEKQAIWADALKNTYLRTSHLLKRELERKFWDEELGVFYSHPKESKKTSSQHIDSRFLLPLAFGHISPKVAQRALDEVKRKYSSMHGITLKARDAKAPAFLRETSYSSLTGIAACAFFQYGRIDDGMHLLINLALNTDKEHAGHIAEGHKLKDGSSVGELTSVAAHALLVHAVDNYLFGIKARGNKILIEPKLPSDWHEIKRKHKLAGENHVALTVRRDGPGFEGEIKVHGREKQVVELILPEHIKEINVNGKTQKGHKILFKPDEVNLFVARA